MGILGRHERKPPATTLPAPPTQKATIHSRPRPPARTGNAGNPSPLRPNDGDLQMSVYKDFILCEVTGIEEALSKVGPAFVEKIKDAFTETKTLEDIGTTLMASAVRTIDAGGRPAPYKPLAASTIASKKSSKILVNKGTMRQSLDYEVVKKTLYLTSEEYLTYHQFEEKRTKARFPARPVWGVQEEDQADIRDAIVAGIKRNL